MTARRTARWALHWAITCTAAAITSLAASLPFTGPAASFVGTVAAAGVCLVGIACAPNPGGTR